MRKMAQAKADLVKAKEDTATSALPSNAGTSEAPPAKTTVPTATRGQRCDRFAQSTCESARNYCPGRRFERDSHGRATTRQDH